MDANVELIKVCHLNLEVEGIEIVPDINFSIKKQRGYLITGPNEEANILLLNIIGGIFTPLYHHYQYHQQGQVLFRGMDIYEDNEREIKKVREKIAFVFREGTMISNLTVRENLLLPFRFHRPSENCAAAMEKIEADFNFFGIPGVLDKRPDLVSYCLKKKLAFIRASLQEPDLILVEKPMFNLDEEDQEQVVHYLENLKKNGTTLIIVSRSQSILETLIDEAILVEDGKIADMIGKTDRKFAFLSRFTKGRSGP